MLWGSQFAWCCGTTTRPFATYSDTPYPSLAPAEPYHRHHGLTAEEEALLEDDDLDLGGEDVGE